MTITEKIEGILGRKVEIEQVDFKGQRGFMPLYFNFTFKNNVSELFDTDKEKCLDKFYNMLLKGDTSGTDTERE